MGSTETMKESEIIEGWGGCSGGDSSGIDGDGGSVIVTLEEKGI